MAEKEIVWQAVTLHRQKGFCHLNLSPTIAEESGIEPHVFYSLLKAPFLIKIKLS
jgi:hypothetical protein